MCRGYVRVTSMEKEEAQLQAACGVSSRPLLLAAHGDSNALNPIVGNLATIPTSILLVIKSYLTTSFESLCLIIKKKESYTINVAFV